MFIQQRSLKQKQKKTETTKNGFAVFNQRCNTSNDSYAHQQSCKHIRTRQSNLPTSSRFPLVSWPCDPCCYTNWDRSGSACNFSGSCHVDSRSVCQILPGAPRDLWEVCHAGVLSRCPTATYGIGTKEGKSWEHICCSPKIFPHVVLFFPDV